MPEPQWGPAVLDGKEETFFFALKTISSLIYFNSYLVALPNPSQIWSNSAILWLPYYSLYWIIHQTKAENLHFPMVLKYGNIWSTRRHFPEKFFVYDHSQPISLSLIVARKTLIKMTESDTEMETVEPDLNSHAEELSSCSLEWSDLSSDDDQPETDSSPVKYFHEFFYGSVFRWPFCLHLGQL